jgi:hypothetical protein
MWDETPASLGRWITCIGEPVGGIQRRSRVGTLGPSAIEHRNPTRNPDF